MTGKRTRYGSDFKAKVALEAIRGELTTSQLATKHDVHQTMINDWKRMATAGLASIFDGNGGKGSCSGRRGGEIPRQNRPMAGGTRFVGARLRSMSLARRRQMVNRDHPVLSIVRQCDLVSINRSGLYHEPAGETALNLALMRLIDAQFMETPWYGSRQMARHLRREGHGVGHKRVRRLIAVMGLVPIYQRPRTTVPHSEHRPPYLLRDLTIDRPNQVWRTDITYIPMRRRFLYPVAIMDWWTRKVLSWRVSNTMDVGFCIEALEDALARHGRPEIFNSDQGSQFTSSKFTKVLRDAETRISIDGKGRWMDNGFIERLWRSLKYECVCLHAFETGSELRGGRTQWVGYYNARRPHSSLDGRTPDEVYSAGVAGNGEHEDGTITKRRTSRWNRICRSCPPGADRTFACNWLV